MSVPRNVELDEIKNHSYLLVLHLAKLFMFPYEDWSNHWKGEIRAHLGKTRRIRPKNKFLSADEIVDTILSTVDLDAIISDAVSAVNEKASYEYKYCRNQRGHSRVFILGCKRLKSIWRFKHASS